MLLLLMWKAYSDAKEAERKNRRANRIIRKANRTANEKQKACALAIHALGTKKLQMLDKSIRRFISAYEKMNGIDLSQPSNFDELSKLRLDTSALAQLKEMSGMADSILKNSTVVGSLTGALSAAAGWLGLAEGSLVGGLVGSVFGLYEVAKASAQLDYARANLAKARLSAEELETAGTLCDGIRRRAYLFFRLLIRLDTLLMPLIVTMENAIKTHGTDYRTFSTAEMQAVSGAVTLVGSIKTVLDTPILTDDGKLTELPAEIAEISEKLTGEGLR